jgi:predicted acyl esterase
LDAFPHRLRTLAAEGLFRLLPEGREQWLARSIRVLLQVRHVDRFEERSEADWPLARTSWTRLYLDPDGETLSSVPPAKAGSVSFDAGGDGLTFLSNPLSEQTEITGPLATRLRVSSSTIDADIFRVFSADTREIVFAGAVDPHTPVAQGWLRASHRKLDSGLSRPWRPYHAHDEKQPLTPGEPVYLDIEIWPTSIVVPAGCRIALSVRGRDYEWQKATGLRLSNFKNELTDCGPFLHDDPRNRPRPCSAAGRPCISTVMVRIIFFFRSFREQAAMKFSTWADRAS